MPCGPAEVGGAVRWSPSKASHAAGSPSLVAEDARLLSCGSPRLRRPSRGRRAVSVGPSLLTVHPVCISGGGLEVFRFARAGTTSVPSFHVVQRHYRVSPQRSVTSGVCPRRDGLAAIVRAAFRRWVLRARTCTHAVVHTLRTIWRRCVRSSSDPGSTRVTPSMGFGAFRRTAVRSLRAGLPHRRHPLSGFLTHSAASSRDCLVALFHATVVHRLRTFRAFSTRPAVAPLGALCSRVVRAVADPFRRWHDARDFRALLRSDSRTLVRVTRTRASRCSPGLCPPRGLPNMGVGLAASPHVLAGNRRTSGSRTLMPGRGSGESRQPPRGLSPRLTPRRVRTHDTSLGQLPTWTSQAVNRRAA
jgi:hypothetical protein